jgi:hypothetical protein
MAFLDWGLPSEVFGLLDKYEHVGTAWTGHGPIACTYTEQQHRKTQTGVVT